MNLTMRNVLGPGDADSALLIPNIQPCAVWGRMGAIRNLSPQGFRCPKSQMKLGIP